MRWIGPADNPNLFATDALCGTVSQIAFFAIRTVEFHQHCVVHFRTEGVINRIQIGAMTVALQLNAISWYASQTAPISTRSASGLVSIAAHSPKFAIRDFVGEMRFHPDILV